MPEAAFYSVFSDSLQAKADRNGRIDLIHQPIVHVAHVLAQTALVNGADLFEQNDGIFRKSDIVARK